MRSYFGAAKQSRRRKTDALARFVLPAALLGGLALEHAAPDLVFFNRLEQGLEVALPEAVVAFSLDEFEKDRADDRFRKTLQQHLGIAALHHALAVDENAVPLEAIDGLAVLREALVDPLVVEPVGGRHEPEPVRLQRLDGLVEVARAHRDVLDALSLVLLQVLLDLARLPRVLVDGDADLAIRARHGARVQARELAGNVEVADLAEVEDAGVEVGPLVHAPTVHVVGQVVDVVQPRPVRMRVAL